MNIYKHLLEKKGHILALAPMKVVMEIVFGKLLGGFGKQDRFLTGFLIW